jgi:hypothetical protein
VSRFETWNKPKALKTMYQTMTNQNVNSRYQTANDIASDAFRSQNTKSNPQRKNLQHYTFGGMRSIKHSSLYKDIDPSM